MQSWTKYFLLAFIVIMVLINLMVFLNGNKQKAQEQRLEQETKLEQAIKASEQPVQASAQTIEGTDSKTNTNADISSGISTKRAEQIESEANSINSEQTTGQTNAIPQNLTTEERIQHQGLVNIKKLIPGIKIDLRYATENNFMGKLLYKDLKNAYLQPEVAQKLVVAQRTLQKYQKEYTLVVFDACRPQSVQYEMWDKVKGTKFQRYVASPTAGSLHNFGAAVDLSILDEFDRELDMGTEYDFFGELAQPRYEEDFYKKGELSREQIDNRRLLRRVMKEAGFSGILSEWWHFNGVSRSVVRQKFEIVK